MEGSARNIGDLGENGLTKKRDETPVPEEANDHWTSGLVDCPGKLVGRFVGSA